MDRLFILLKALVVSLAVWGFSHWKSNQVPTQFINTPILQNEPIQKVTRDSPINTNVNKQNYQIEPVFDYELWGVVVADHDSSSWYDISHESWGDYINTKDICVIWGRNTQNPFLSKISFTHGNWTCYVQTRSSEAWQKFDMEKLSNNHLIPSSPELKKLISNSHIGDEIRIRGNLVNYSINGGPPRKTSVVRNDRENGACEIIYVREFETLARNNLLWTRMAKLGKLFSLFLALAIVASQIWLHMSYREE